MGKVFYAHRREDGKLQTVKNHLEGTSRLAGDFASSFGSRSQGELAGIVHDIGKYSGSFQKRLLENGPIVDHSTAGAFECLKRNQVYAAICISGHHGGLPDLGTRDDVDEGTFLGRMRRAREGRLPDYSAWDGGDRLVDAEQPLLPMDDSLSEMFYIRMLYSCLVDADYLDTESFMLDGKQPRGTGASIAELRQKLDWYFREKGWIYAEGGINGKRSAILREAIVKGSLPRGLFTLSVDTGGGKTTSSLAFALEHATRNHLDRIIYVIPYISVTEQTADVFRLILGDNNILEHHSSVEYDAEECAPGHGLEMKLASENWDTSVVVTTAVQFFESLFGNRSSKCRKLHNIANSAIIFDEAQMLPVPYLLPCVYAMSQLTAHYGCSIVLCTATQPALEVFFKQFLGEYKTTEIHEDRDGDSKVFRRCRIRHGGHLSWAGVAERMNRAKQVLCIVNSRAAAKKVYRRLCGEGAYCLSTLLTPADRRRMLREIRERLACGEECRVVSTSLIECGVDIDFPFVLREEAGIDSILQAAGRCNREGKWDPDKCMVLVFHPEDKPPAIFQSNIDVARKIMREYDDITSPEAVHAYFHELFFIKGKEAFDKHGIVRKSGDGTFPFRTVAREFCMIDQPTVAVFIPVGEGEALIKRKLEGEAGTGITRALGNYAVNIFESHFRKLAEAGDIQDAGDGIWYLSNMNLYDETGLSVEEDS